MLRQQKEQQQVARPSTKPPVRAKPSLIVMESGLLTLVCLKDVTLQQRQNLSLHQHGRSRAARCSTQSRLKVHRVLQQLRVMQGGLPAVL
jgi:hypothetical protein